MKAVSRVMLVLSVLVFGGFRLNAQDAVVQTVPEATELIAKHIEASGGRERLEQLKTTVSEGKFEMSGAGINAQFSVIQSAPNKFLFTMEIPNLGSIKRGTDGENAWEVNAFTGARRLTGVEKTQMMRQSEMAGELKLQERYDVEVVGVEDVDGTECFEVKLTPKNATEEEKEFLTETRLIDAKTYLLKKHIVKAKTPLGDIDVATFLDDYRTVSGLTMPHKISQKMVGQQQVMTIEKVQINVDVKDDTFALPEEVAALTE